MTPQVTGLDPAGKRILIVKPSSLGDVVHTLPVAHALKRRSPSCSIGWIVQEPFRAVLEHDPAVDEILPIFIPSTSDPQAPRGVFFSAFAATFNTWRSLRRKLRERPYDLTLDLHASFRSGLLGLANPGGVGVGFADAKELNTLFQSYRLTPDPDKPHAVDKNLLFADFLGASPEPADFRVYTGADERERVAAFLAHEFENPEAPLVYANPAARWVTKHWSVPAWAELADLSLERLGVNLVFGGSPQDVALIGDITGRMKGRAAVSAGRFSLAESIALIEAANVYVGVDSGPMHIAAFTNTKAVALFGPTDPALVGPYGAGHRVLRRADLDCLACRKRACADPRCLEGIRAETVFEATADLLRSY